MKLRDRTAIATGAGRFARTEGIRTLDVCAGGEDQAAEYVVTCRDANSGRSRAIAPGDNRARPVRELASPVARPALAPSPAAGTVLRIKIDR